MGSRYSAGNDQKATLGLTGPTGGFILVPSVVDQIEKPRAKANFLRGLVTVRNVPSAAVDIPYRVGLPAAAPIAVPGELKDNVNLTYTSYTASLYTIARIYDLSTRFVRTSAGAAQADALSELATAIGLGEKALMLSGSGTAEPYGLLTALTASGAFTSTFTAAATVAGSVVAAIGTCLGALAGRSVTTGLSAIMSTTSWAKMLVQGTDAAGFFLSGISGAQSLPGVALGQLVSPFGIPVYADPTISEDRVIVGDFSSLKLYIGSDFRVETSDSAGERWDRNLLGVRGEEDFAFDARAAVAVGNFQQVVDLVP
jgi:HK97 family phage major capsid protein